MSTKGEHRKMIEMETKTGRSRPNSRFLIVRTASNVARIAVFGVAIQATAQSSAVSYPKMAAIKDYLMTQDAEITLARSAAPEPVAKDADFLVMDAHGYHTAIKGRNGFVCVVQRSWTAGLDEPDFWNPKLRAPICYNAAAARSYLPRVLRRTEFALAGRSKQELASGMNTAFERKEIPAIEAGSMCYMLSKSGYLGDQAGHWHPHIMVFAPETKEEAWGANLPGSPVISTSDHLDRVTVFMIPVAKWSDGSSDSEGH